MTLHKYESESFSDITNWLSQFEKVKSVGIKKKGKKWTVRVLA